jgi:hypothetical protein
MRKGAIDMEKFDEKDKTFAGYIIIGVCLIMFGFLGSLAFVLKADPYDPETLCIEDISEHTLVVVDKTDSFNKNQQRFIFDYINKLKAGVRVHEKLSIFTLTRNTYISPEPIFSKCNPGRGENANALYQNPKKIQLYFDKSFSKPLNDIIENILSDNTDSFSPIFEMIRELSFRNDFSNETQKRTLIIISDMMHHTSKYSHYRNKINYRSFSRGSYADEVKVRLDSVNVKIVYLLRGKLDNLQGKRHLDFWKDYFEDVGAVVDEVRNFR